MAKTLLKLKNDIPTRDTFARVFARLTPSAFQKRFVRWVQAITSLAEDEVIAIDGKTVRRSHKKGSETRAMYLVSAWATRNRLTLSQIKVDEKSNEITAAPELLRLLAIKGCIVTVDSLNTQKDIANEMCEQGANYVLSLNENHTTLHNEVVGIFETV